MRDLHWDCCKSCSDLRVYCQPLRAGLSHYRDNTGLEVDAILRKCNGDWIAVEIKLGWRANVDAALQPDDGKRADPPWLSRRVWCAPGIARLG